MRNILSSLLLVGLLFASTAEAQVFKRTQKYAPPPSPPAQTKELPKENTVDPMKTPDVPDFARWEVERRGNLVQEVGTIRADRTEHIADALDTPVDDTDKWYLTLVTMDGCKACEKLKYDLATSKVFQAWVHVDDPVTSPLHYQVRRIEDAESFQKDWFANIRKQINKEGLPAVIIQPPRNGKFGPNATVVKILNGYSGDPEKYTGRLRDAIIAYVDVLKKKGLITHHKDPDQDYAGGGYKQDTGAPPPFSVPAKPVDLVQPSGPVDWPPTAQELTVAQLMAACPGAPPEFILQQYQLKLKDINVVSLNWLMYQQQKTPPKESPPSVPTTPVVVEPAPTPAPVNGTILKWLVGLMGTGVFLQVLNLAMPWIHTYVASTPSPVDDIVVNIVESILSKKLQSVKPNETVKAEDLTKPVTL